MTSVVYQWPAFSLVFDRTTGRAVTHYPDGAWSGCAPHADDAYHAERLGITAAEHRLEHELAHHLAAHARGLGDASRVGCRIIWRDAHQVPQDAAEAALDEWMITALQYLAHGRRCDWGALLDLERDGVDVPALARHLRWLLDAPAHGELVAVRTRAA